MTCPPNALRTGTDVIRLEPGASWTGELGHHRMDGLGADRARAAFHPFRRMPGARAPAWVEAVMSSLDLSRLQFATTSIYHFLFVPLTIGLAFLVALLHTAWFRRRDEAYLRLTRFFGTLLVINIAIGVVTGLVQEFQFGMNWSAYSRFVGGVFGAPLAIEGLAAFFLESTFLGLWIFGWGRLPERVHLLTIWMVSLGSVLSAAFIMAANSWMQHPVGYTLAVGEGGADQHLGGAVEPGVRVGVHPRRCWRPW